MWVCVVDFDVGRWKEEYHLGAIRFSSYSSDTISNGKTLFLKSFVNVSRSRLRCFEFPDRLLSILFHEI